MRLRTTQKQTQNLRSLSSVSRSSAHNIIRRNLTPMRASGVLFVSLVATAGISSLAFGLHYGARPARQTSLPTTKASSSTYTASLPAGSSTRLHITSSQPSGDAPDAPPSSVSGQATINNETIPLTQGTVERSFTDSNGTTHTVTISLDNNTATIQSNSSTANVQIHSSSSTSTFNTTRGSPTP